ncbi:MAG: glycoside hydrolase family 3 N-terminal domain-containing protein [Chloroflexota bacterium]
MPLVNQLFTVRMWAGSRVKDNMNKDTATPTSPVTGAAGTSAPDRAGRLLRRMTLAEKVGQLVQIYTREDIIGPDLDQKIAHGLVGSIFGISDVAEINRYQRLAVQASRLGTPLLVGNDVVHGFRTVFPIPLAESSSWDLPLMEQTARAAAEEASACGTNWIFAPMVDIARDPRWGRIAEGAGEDVFLGRAIAAARVRGFQSTDLESGRRIAACVKHYVGYGAAEGGRDYNTVDISERTLRDTYLPPFKAAFDAGAGSLMSAFNEIGGIPSSANHLILRTILRDEWGWQGVALSDYEAIRELIPHGIASDLRDAARLAMTAGIDMDMMSYAYADHLAELVADGSVPEAIVDEAVRRVLLLKLQLGLFDQPYTDEALPNTIVRREDFQDLALRAAHESMVLLKNDAAILPLSPNTRRIALIGPLADNKADLLGCWAVFGQKDQVETILEAVTSRVSDPGSLVHVSGCPIVGDGPDNIFLAIEAARAADIIIAVLGESVDMSGEAHSRAHLGLPGRQQELLDALAATGRPIIGVLLSGRPLVIPRVLDQVDALFVAWHSGVCTARALADILFGIVNPSGKLTATWPCSEGQIPIYYAHKNTGRPAQGEGTKQFDEPFKSRYIDESNEPLFPFGFGLSYTTFAYSNLVVETPAVAHDGTLVVTATIKNTGSQAGAEIVQLYVRDLVASITRPVRELKGFRRVTLAPGEEQQLRFVLDVSELGFTGPDMRHVVEPGAFRVWIGPDSTQGLEGDFILEG